MNIHELRPGRGLPRVLVMGAGLLALAAAAYRFAGPAAAGWDPAILPLAALGIACFAAAVALGTEWLPAALHGGIYLVAQACALQLIDPERHANYAHFAPWSDLGTRLGWLLPVVAQWTLGLSALRRSLTRAGSSAGPAGWLRPAAVLAIVAFGAAVPTLSFPRYAAETGLAMIVTLGGLLNLWSFALALPAHGIERVQKALARRLSLGPAPGGTGTWDRRLPWIAAGLATLAAAIFARAVLGGVPHIDDSISNLFQARTLALGRLSVAAPADSAAFHVVEVLNTDGRWFGYGFPGWPAALALGVLAGLPWLVNPLLAGVTVLLTHRLLLKLDGHGTANPVTILLAASPWLLFMSAEMMGHPLSLVLALLALNAVVCARERGVRWPLLAGIALGALALTRPLDAAVIGIAAVVWRIGESATGAGPGAWIRAVRVNLPLLATLGVAAAAVTSLLFFYNASLTGDPLYTPQMMWTDRAWGIGSDRYGFGPDIGIRAWPGIDPLPGHGPADVVLNLNKNLNAAGTDLFGWAGGSLILILLAFGLPGRPRSGRLELALLTSTVVAYSGYWFAGGPDLGPRYWYIAIPAFVALSVTGARRLASLWGGGRVAATIALASLAAVLAFVPWRAATKYHRYRDIGDEIRQLADQHSWDDALIFIRSDDREAYQAAFNFLDPAFRPGRPVFARDAGQASRNAVIRGFPDRTVWIVGPDSAQDRRLRIVAGPLPPGSEIR